MDKAKIIILLISLLNTGNLVAQTLTIDQLEKKWQYFYTKGCNSFNLRHYEEAKVDFNESISLLKKNGALGTIYNIYSLMKLAESCYVLNDTTNLHNITNDILTLKHGIRPGSKKFIEYLYSLGVYYSNIGQFDTALTYLTDAESNKEILEQIEGMSSKIYHRKAICYFYQKDFNMAISEEKKCIEADRYKIPSYTESLLYFLYKNKDWKQLDEYATMCFENSREPVLQSFSFSKNKDREKYWGEHGLFFTDFLPTYAYANSSTILSQLTFDAALLSKGILLAAENKSNEITLNSNNEELLKSYEHYKELQGKKTRTLDEEFEMQSLSEVFLDYQKDHKYEFRDDFRINWKDVQKFINDDEIAIEFLNIPSVNDESEYVAVILRKSYEAPKLIKLCNFKQLKIISPENYYTTEKLYNLIWKPLESEFKGVKNIYFSPTGMFYNTGIEYLPNKEGINVNALYNIYRLSSTKELVMRSKLKIEKSILLGGVNFDAKVSDMLSFKKDYETNFARDLNVDSLDIRAASSSGGVPYLPGTMDEVNEIKTILDDYNNEANVISGNDGSEVSFYNIGGKDVNLMHIATHGFYYANKNIGKSKNIDKIFRDINLHFYSPDIEIVNEDKMLTRSGLLLAGANNRLKKIKLPKGIEDGILYADEISHVNLSKVNLLVLSACQSGLGDVSSCEGVFGLQRGFKLAGVKSIIMSLWKVDDNATRILMTEMYRNLAKGKSINESLVNAQFNLRTYDNGRYDNPKYWAAFIALDGLN